MKTKHNHKNTKFYRRTFIHLITVNLVCFQGEVACKRLKVLYLHNNVIKQITNLNHLTQLTHLYLQWNRIRKIENLNQLKNLRKLYLSYNEIQSLEGLENLHLLEELHLEYQTLPPQHNFTFDLNSLIGISVNYKSQFIQ